MAEKIDKDYKHTHMPANGVYSQMGIEKNIIYLIARECAKINDCDIGGRLGGNLGNKLC